MERNNHQFKHFAHAQTKKFLIHITHTIPRKFVYQFLMNHWVKCLNSGNFIHTYIEFFSTLLLTKTLQFFRHCCWIFVVLWKFVHTYLNTTVYIFPAILSKFSLHSVSNLTLHYWWQKLHSFLNIAVKPFQNCEDNIKLVWSLFLQQSWCVFYTTADIEHCIINDVAPWVMS